MPNQTLNIPSGSGNGAGSGGTTVTPSNTNTTPTFNHSNLYTSGQCTWYVFDRRSSSRQTNKHLLVRCKILGWKCC